jgi:hypothetical protein
MPQEEITLTFYRIDKCGYYARRQTTPAFGTVDEIFDDLGTWIRDKELGDTCPFGPNYHGFLGTYCFNLTKHSNGDFLFVTWNTTPNSNGRVASVDPRSTVGSPIVDLTTLPPNFIPGYPTYFWILPNQSIMATITFQHALNGQSAVQRLVRNFAAKFSRFVATRDDDNDDADIVVDGYRDSIGGEIRHLYPRFRTKLIRNRTRLAELRDNHTSIRRIVRKSTISTDNDADRSLWQDFLLNLGMDSRQNVRPIEIKYEIKLTPSADDFDQIVTTFEKLPNRDWDDVGFVFEGGETQWLSSTIARENLTLDVERENAEIASPEALIDQLVTRRRDLLQSIE